MSDEHVEKGFLEFSFGFNKMDQDFQETECSVSSVSKYQFVSSRDVSGFVQVPETMSFSVEESFEGFTEKDFISFNGVSRKKDIEEEEFEGLRKGESDQFIDFKVSDLRNDQQIISQVELVHHDQGEDCSEEAGLNEKEGLHSELDELSQNPDEGINDSLSDKSVDSREVISLRISSSSDEEDLTFNKFNFDNIDDDEFIELEPHMHHSVDDLIKENPDGDLHDNKCDDELETQSLNGLENSEEHCSEERKSPDSNLYDNKSDDESETQSLNGLENSEERCSEERTSMEWESDEEEEEEDFLMEHKYLIEQMKMEAKHSRTGGLPTILEESETTKIPDDLKPLQIDETFDHSDRMEEIQKFYKSYSDKMRKMDILNRQTMHAISKFQFLSPLIFLLLVNLNLAIHDFQNIHLRRKSCTVKQFNGYRSEVRTYLLRRTFFLVFFFLLKRIS